MTKHDVATPNSGKFVVRDPKSGRFLEVRGADSMKLSKLPIRKGIDLTKPIAEQALKESNKRAKNTKG